MKNTKTLVLTSVFAALICVLTMFPQFRVPFSNGGYVHLGDAVIILSVYFIGIYAVPAAAVGSALADLFSGYVIYAPATFVIKALMAFAAYYIFKMKGSGLFYAIAAIVSELIMSAGYFLYEVCLYGIAAAAASLPYNFIQAAGGVILGIVFYYIVKASKLKEKL